MKILKTISFFYEIIQNTIGYIEYRCNHLKINHKFKNSNIVYIDYFDSHVLGKWIFINPNTDDSSIIRHEYGHRIQSYILGPLYLLVIYLPSYLHYKWFTTQNKSWDEYYDFITEKWADKLTHKNKKKYNMIDFIPGDKVVHKTKKCTETIINFCKIKIDGNWVEGVVYEGIDYKTNMPMTFVRTLEDFNNNFELYHE